MRAETPPHNLPLPGSCHSDEVGDRQLLHRVSLELGVLLRSMSERLDKRRRGASGRGSQQRIIECSHLPRFCDDCCSYFTGSKDSNPLISQPQISSEGVRSGRGGGTITTPAVQLPTPSTDQ